MTKRSYTDKWASWGMATLLQHLIGYRVKKTYSINELIQAAHFWDFNNQLKDRLIETYKHVEADEKTKELQEYVIYTLTWGFKKGGE